MQFTITGEDQYGIQHELTLEAGTLGNTVDVTVYDGDCDAVAREITFDVAEMRDALNFVDAELSER